MSTKLFKKSGSDNWYFKFGLHGKTIYRSTGTNDKAKAQEIADRTKASAYDVIVNGQKARRIWQEAVVKWLTNSDKKSLDTDRYHFKWLQTYLDDVYLDEIDEAKIDEIIQAKLKVAGKTRVNRTTELVRGVLRKAMNEWKWIDNVPHIPRFRETQGRLRWLTHDEAARLMDELQPHTKAMALFTLATGLRESNVTGLEWSQIDMQRKIAWIHADQAKASKVIRVPLNQDAVNVLRGQIGQHATRVFTYRGKPIEKAGTKFWREALKRAEIENFTWHDLRHTWASWHVQAGTPLNVLQQLGGWASYSMVLRYAHLSDDHISHFCDNVLFAKTTNILKAVKNERH